MSAATVVQQLCKSCRTCFKFYCMFYFTCDRSFTNDVLSISVELAAGDKTTSSQHWTVRAVWTDSEHRLRVMWKRQSGMVDHLGSAGLVQQLGRTAQVYRRRTHRHVRPETLCTSAWRQTRREPMQRGPGNHYCGALSQPHSVCPHHPNRALGSVVSGTPFSVFLSDGGAPKRRWAGENSPFPSLSTGLHGGSAIRLSRMQPKARKC